MEWIPCAERMPERGVKVLVWAPYEGTPQIAEWQRWDGPDRGYTDVWYRPGPTSLGKSEVTHWMPLPEPPCRP